jgi:hypothetical protein
MEVMEVRKECPPAKEEEKEEEEREEEREVGTGAIPHQQ